MKKALTVLGAVCVATLLLLFLTSSATSVQLDPPVRVVGMETPVQVRVANPHGIRRITASLEQGGKRYSVFESAEPATRFWFWRKKEHPRTVSFPAGKKQAPELADGKATLIITAQGNDFRASTGSLAVEVEVNTRPLKVTADGEQHYINQGGSELVTFTVEGYWTEAGVRVGEHTFRSYPIPGKGPNERFSIFAFPWDTPANTVPYIYATNPTGAEARANFWFKVFPKNFRSRQLELTDAFLEKVVGQIDPTGSGDIVERFLKINRDMRIQNNTTLADLRFKTEERMLWSGPFIQLGNSKVEALFADTRTYMYQGKAIDKQTHLGFDLSVTQHVPVSAANDGRVIYAGDLGIYGNCVVIDHGYGLQSIYAHLSAIAVKPEDIVKRGQTIGNSGSTGLAGGDHLHFSMQVDGVQVTAVEWWDQAWIKNRILSKLPAVSQ